MKMSFIDEFLWGKFTDFNRALKKPKKVRSLKLEIFDNDFNDYSHELSSFINLREINLHVSVNHSNRFPKEIGNLNNLEKITILNYPLTEFPQCLIKLEKLKYLYLRGNEIEEVPKFKEKVFQNLKVLKIENCELKRIPEFVVDLNELEILSFALTKINTIAEIKFPQTIQELDLAGTMISSINKNDLPKSLKKLFINGSLFNYKQSKVNYKEIGQLESIKPDLKVIKNIY
jgi:Leucine-rich repeat (LRR) protein